MFNHQAARSSASDELVYVQNQTTSAAKPSFVYQSVVKRGFDTLCILLSLPFILPILIVVALLIARDGHSPLYSQKRIGLNGKVFKLWKLRTMVPNAELRLQELIKADPAVAREWNKDQKLKNDPRITKIGQFLRKTSIDELPQLWNVLRGDMSLVGPRPMMTDQKDLYKGQAYYEMRPGLTGLWQISDRNNCTFAARASFDTKYHQQMSFVEDCRILVATVGVVVRGTGY
ncbi:sugar transferase [Yoonia sp. SS1-5]|uniref:Sugar transferase n=1 Tax=Yoonia rhodophyticola TaxID=3137370 RepID=A0AAN0NK94_9RHOB